MAFFSLATKIFVLKIKLQYFQLFGVFCSNSTAASPNVSQLNELEAVYDVHHLIYTPPDHIRPHAEVQFFGIDSSALLDTGSHVIGY